MARIIVQSDHDPAVLLMSEEVHPCHLDNEHAAEQFIERLAWAIQDGEAHLKLMPGSWIAARASLS